jgi:hypothetical protein
MSICKHVLSIIAESLFGIGLATSVYAQQQPILVIPDSAWANTSIQGTPPAALIVGTGACVSGPDCWGSTSSMTTLNPLIFYPSSHTQTVTVSASWGTTFDAYAGSSRRAVPLTGQ